ncbi:MAG: HAD family hydrolase [Burkholderiales bacterium]|nr:HAD family hydrolase [Burkholderiales bacterium]
MKYKAVVFDLDGTLLNTILDIANPVNLVLKQYGMPTHEIENFRYLIGNGIGNLVYRALPSEVAESTLYSKVLESVLEEYQKHLNRSTKPYDGITDMLQNLANLGVSINILSNKADEFMDEVVSQYFSEFNFDFIFGARHGVPLKPNPHSIFEIMSELDIDSDECVFVGDSDADMQAAKNAGVYAVGVNWGFRGKEELLRNGADIVIDTPGELQKIFN